MAYDPWGEVPAGWSVDFVVMPARGACRWSRRSILLDIRLSGIEERCTLAHELVHAERGPFPCWLTTREESIVDAKAARRLIPLDALGEALAWSLHPTVAAEELDVDPPTLEALLRNLTGAEVEVLRRRLEHHFEGA
nr:MAG TPA: HTH-type transcriptional regulator [Caudoviricetes sp.]